MVNWKKFFVEEDSKEDDLKVEFYDEEKEKKKTKSEKELKFKNLFSQKNINKQSEESYDEKQESYSIEEYEQENNELEKFVVETKEEITNDYKTKIQNQKTSILEKFANLFRSNENADADFQDDNQTETKNYVKEYKEEDVKKERKENISFSNLKQKINYLLNYGITKEELSDKDIDIEEKVQDENKSKENKKDKLLKYFVNKKDVYEDFEDEDVSSKLEKIEQGELNIKEKEDINIKEKLTSLGIETKELKDVDIFEERDNLRTHPTLASMKVKRILQDKNIDNLATELVFEDSKDKFKEDLLNIKKEEKATETTENNIRKSKNKDEIEKLQKELNAINRKEEKIEQQKNKIIDKNNFVDEVIKEINDIEEIETASLGEFKVEETNTEKIRRDKISYTSVDDVLKNNEELLEDDIDKVSKMLVIDRTEENISEGIEEFRNCVNNDSSQNKKVNTEQNTLLDNLLSETKIVEKDDVTVQIEKLEDNLEKIKSTKQEIEVDNKEQIFIEEVAKINDLDYPEYEEIKKESETQNILDSYSDYNLDLEEVEELISINKIEEQSENTNIDSLNKEFNTGQNINDIDNFKEQKTYTPVSKDNEEKEQSEKIEYKEKLYSENVKEYFVDDSSLLTFREYKTQDRGYRPVSKEKMESNRKKLDDIFAKYTTINNIPINNLIKNKENSQLGITRNVNKFKPSPVYSSVYGEVKKTELAKKEKLNVKKSKKENQKEKANLFKEIASQDENVWNIDINSRVPKIKKSKK